MAHHCCSGDYPSTSSLTFKRPLLTAAFPDVVVELVVVGVVEAAVDPPVLSLVKVRTGLLTATQNVLVLCTKVALQRHQKQFS